MAKIPSHVMEHVVPQNKTYPNIIQTDKTGCFFIYDCHHTVHKEEHPLDLFNQYCMYHGSTLEGRKISFRYVTQSRQKPAILLDEKSELIYFPTEKDTNPTCVWLHYQNIVDIKKVDASHTSLLFSNGYQTVIDVPIRTIQLQMKRCELYLSVMNSLENTIF